MDTFTIADKTFSSRLIVGTGKYPSHQIMADAHRASGTEMVTVAVRRVDLKDRGAESMRAFIDETKIFLLPNTAGCYTAEDAIRTARLGREVGLSNWVKLEVIGDERTLFPDNVALLYWSLHRRGHLQLDARLKAKVVRIVLAGAAMGAALWFTNPIADSYMAGGLWQRVIALTVLCGSGAAVYGAASLLFGAYRLQELRAALRRS